MSKKTKIILIIALSLITCLVSAYLLDRYFFAEESRDYIKGQLYSINPNTILEDLSQGKTDVFTPQKYRPDEKTREYVEWKLADYDLVAEALHELMWEETLEGWKISLLSYRWDCKYITKGPQQADFRYFKVEKLRERKSRFVSNLYVLPNWNSVDTTMWEHYPRIIHWDEINLAKLEISADEALDIAEKNGGAESRAAVGNSCWISVFFNTASHTYDGWLVIYLSSSQGTIDQYFIDPLTGEVVAHKEP